TRHRSILPFPICGCHRRVPKSRQSEHREPRPAPLSGHRRQQSFIPGAESEGTAVPAERASGRYRRALELDPKNWNASTTAGSRYLAARARLIVSWEPRTHAGQQTPAPIRVAPPVQQQKLITKVNAVSPAGGGQALRFVVVIGKDGRVFRETLVNGNPWLVPAAVQALHQWVYQPTLVSGTPVEVVTEVLVPFHRTY
ncbi:MAG TPA: hypothetical protein VML19_16635, partial [Verrucomicrobiae bacterium]|nr:hypothetical protein [Verrucomicrobiae bacterium]